MIKPGSAVDSERYNTEYIDTRITFEGQEYFVCLRAMCVGQLLLDIYVRCRPVSDGTPNVHSKNTPLNAELLKYIYFEYVSPRHSEIHQICRNVGRILGQNFYAHDILLASSRRLPLCETGVKFDDGTIIKHLWPISSDIDFMKESFSYKIAEKAAEYTIHHAIEEGVFRNKIATKTSG